MGQRRDRLDNRLEKQKLTRAKNRSRKAKERIRKAERVEKLQKELEAKLAGKE